MSFELTAKTSQQETHLHRCCVFIYLFILLKVLWVFTVTDYGCESTGSLQGSSRLFFFVQVINIALAFTMKLCLTLSNNAFLFPVNFRSYFYMPSFFSWTSLPPTVDLADTAFCHRYFQVHGLGLQEVDKLFSLDIFFIFKGRVCRYSQLEKSPSTSLQYLFVLACLRLCRHTQLSIYWVYLVVRQLVKAFIFEELE